MTNILNNQNKYQTIIDKNSLKYGYCSYFTLAYIQDFPNHNIIKISEFDDELNEHFLVHYVLQKDEYIFDSLGKYSTIDESISEISDIKFMNYVNKLDVIDQIIKDFGRLDPMLYKHIRTYVRTNYTYKK